MRRRDFLRGVSAGIAATLSGRAIAAAGSEERGTGGESARRPNVIYVFSDQHRRQSLSFTEAPNLRTPAMERMSREGFEFTNCISNYPLCSPHRAILMTGRWPFQTGVLDNNMPLSHDEMTIGKAFKTAGYRTAYIGKWHLGGTRAEPFGFDHSLIWEKTGTHYDTSVVYPANGDPYVPKGYNATLTTDQAIEYIDAQGDEPFFLMLSLNPPHPRWDDAPKDKVALYADETLLPRRPNETDEVSWPDRQGYCAHVTAMDEEVGRILDKVIATGLGDTTIVCYSSDHGEMLGAHGLRQKRLPFEESIRVPFFVWGPGLIPAGQSSDALFGSIDIMPTLLSMAGIVAPEGCMGKDFSPWLRDNEGPDPDWQPIMHSRRLDEKTAPAFRGLRTKTHTYALEETDNALAPWLLHDNNSDRYQMNNLIDDPAHAALRKELDATLDAWLKSASDPASIAPA